MADLIKIEELKGKVKAAAEEFIKAKAAQDKAHNRTAGTLFNDTWANSREGAAFIAATKLETALPVSTFGAVTNFFRGDKGQSIYARETHTEFRQGLYLDDSNRKVRTAQQELLAAQKELHQTMDAELGTFTVKTADNDGDALNQGVIEGFTAKQYMLFGERKSIGNLAYDATAGITTSVFKDVGSIFAGPRGVNAVANLVGAAETPRTELPSLLQDNLPTFVTRIATDGLNLMKDRQGLAGIPFMSIGSLYNRDSSNNWFPTAMGEPPTSKEWGVSGFIAGAAFDVVRVALSVARDTVGVALDAAKMLSRIPEAAIRGARLAGNLVYQTGKSFVVLGNKIGQAAFYGDKTTPTTDFSTQALGELVDKRNKEIDAQIANSPDAQKAVDSARKNAFDNKKSPDEALKAGRDAGLAVLQAASKPPSAIAKTLNFFKNPISTLRGTKPAATTPPAAGTPPATPAATGAPPAPPAAGTPPAAPPSRIGSFLSGAAKFLGTPFRAWNNFVDSLTAPAAGTPPAPAAGTTPPAAPSTATGTAAPSRIGAFLSGARAFLTAPWNALKSLATGITANAAPPPQRVRNQNPPVDLATLRTNAQQALAAGRLANRASDSVDSFRSNTDPKIQSSINEIDSLGNEVDAKAAVLQGLLAEVAGNAPRPEAASELATATQKLQQATQKLQQATQAFDAAVQQKSNFTPAPKGNTNATGNQQATITPKEAVLMAAREAVRNNSASTHATSKIGNTLTRGVPANLTAEAFRLKAVVDELFAEQQALTTLIGKVEKSGSTPEKLAELKTKTGALEAGTAKFNTEFNKFKIDKAAATLPLNSPTNAANDLANAISTLPTTSGTPGNDNNRDPAVTPTGTGTRPK